MTLYFKRFAAFAFAGGVALAGCDAAGPDAVGSPAAVTANAASGGSGDATFVDLDYSPKLSDAGENAFITTVLRGDGTYETYVTGSEGSERTLAATSSSQSLLGGLVGQAFGPDVANKGNDFAFCRDIGAKVQCWLGEQKENEIEYFNRQRFEVSGEFVDLDYSPKLSASDYNAFLLTVNDGGTFKTYRYNSENNTPSHKALVATSSSQSLLGGLVGQAFGPDVANKGNDFAFCRDIGAKVQCWLGEQKENEIEYFNRQRFEVSGEFVDLDYSPKLSASDYNAFLLTVNDGGTFKTYRYNSENNTPSHKALVATSSSQSLLGGLVGQAFGPNIDGKQNDFRFARDIGAKVQYWIGQQKENEIEYFQRGRFELGSN